MADSYINTNALAGASFAKDIQGTRLLKRRWLYHLTVSGRWHCSQQNLNHNLLCYQRRWANRSRYRIPASRNTTSRRFFLMENKFCLLE